MKKRSRIFYWLCWLLVLTFATVYVVARQLPQRYAGWRQQQQQMKSYQEKADALQQELEQAQDRVEDLSNDPVEHEAAVRHAQRDKVRPGETIYLLKPAPGDESAEAQ